MLMAEILLREQLARGASNSPELQSAIRQTLIRQSLMAQEAAKAGLDRQPATEAQIALARQNILAQLWQQQVLQDAKFAQSELDAEFDRQVRALGPKEYRFRHLLLREEVTAKLLLEKVRAGAPIAKLSEEYSKDEGTRKQGGLTEWTPQGTLFPSLLKALEAAKPGQVLAEAIETPAGWHVVQLDASRAYVAPDKEKVRPQLVQSLLQRNLQERVEALVQRAKID